MKDEEEKKRIEIIKKMLEMIEEKERKMKSD